MKKLLGILLIIFMTNSVFSKLVENTIMIKGVEREYLLALPKGISASTPVLLVLHGGGGSGKKLARQIKLHREPRAKKVLIAYPSGLNKQWNDSREEIFNDKAAANDVLFLKTLIKTLKKTHGLKSSVWITGVSNGGMMSWRMGCEASEMIDGIIPVISAIPLRILGSCSPNNISIFAAAGDQDPIVPYEGGRVKIFGKNRGRVLSFERSLKFFARKLRCAALPSSKEDPNPKDLTSLEYFHFSCKHGRFLEGVKMVNGGHVWPGISHGFIYGKIVGNPVLDFSMNQKVFDIILGPKK